MKMAVASCYTKRSIMPPFPQTSHLELRALPTAVSCARLHAREVILEWGLRGLVDTAELLVSELVTNAIRASCGLLTPVVRIWLTYDRSDFFIRVWDGSDQMPAPQNAGLDAECGRGLLLVETLSQAWGSYPKANGKVVWALV